MKRLFALAALSASVLLSGCATQTLTKPGAFSTVVIDAGHGGKDNGAHSSSGIFEKNVALDTAQRLRPLLQDAGFHTVMTRTGDYFVELDDRVRIANNYPGAILVSVHYNASPSSGPTGVQTFFWRPDSYALATRVENHLAAGTGMDRRGATRRVLRLTHNPRIPSILCECGFLTNSGEASMINDGEFRQRVAESIAAGVIDQRDLGDEGFNVLPPTENDAVVHRTHRATSASKRRRHHHS